MMFSSRLAGLFLCLSLSVFALDVNAQRNRAPVLDFPVKCTIGVDCYVQHYMDTKHGAGSDDYTCGSLTYDRHDGTDIRILTLKQMEKGVPVVAAADGRVFNLRKNVPDQYFSDYSKAKQREVYSEGLGNVVILHHGGGWNTFYAHLKRDSIQVTKGQSVSKGQILGYVGMSGLTDFPHLHFELRHKGVRLDPFTGLKKGSGCDNFETSYWSEEALNLMTYNPTFFVVSGMSETKPDDRKDLEKGDKAETVLNPLAPKLFFWTYYIGSKKGDKITLQLIDPKGEVVKTHTSKPAGTDQISIYRFFGMEKPEGGWMRGAYKGAIKIHRLTGEIFEDSATILVE
ncbi:M23 family metallopeptidase [Sneathiella limimaris]|uniref:M23 family metallopeptidase n=1 Tax=Sneathiella limimaris TaxID=1964213 RepID=UPI00146A3202|nr:M23 family metallopeptidase [Sneathiella limimaris]